MRLLSISGLGGFTNSSIAGILEKLAPLPLARQFRHLQQDGLSGHHYKKEKKKPRVKTGGVFDKVLYREVLPRGPIPDIPLLVTPFVHLLLRILVVYIYLD